MNKLKLSDLEKTWIIDIDGVIFEHNGYFNLKRNELEKPLPGVREFFKRISKEDYVILLTGRNVKYRNLTLKSLKKYGIRFNAILFDLPKGERILINDSKPDGLKTAYAVSLKRNEGLERVKIQIKYKRKVRR